MVSYLVVYFPLHKNQPNKPKTPQNRNNQIIVSTDSRSEKSL